MWSILAGAAGAGGKKLSELTVESGLNAIVKLARNYFGTKKDSAAFENELSVDYDFYTKLNLVRT